MKSAIKALKRAVEALAREILAPPYRPEPVPVRVRANTYD